MTNFQVNWIVFGVKMAFFSPFLGQFSLYKSIGDLGAGRRKALHGNTLYLDVAVPKEAHDNCIDGGLDSLHLSRSEAISINSSTVLCGASASNEPAMYGGLLGESSRRNLRVAR